MSWQVRDATTELARLKREANKIRDALFISGFGANALGARNPGGASGGQNPVGGGSFSGLIASKPILHTLIDVDVNGVSTGVFDKVDLRTSSLLVDATGALDLRFIQGTISDGTILYLKPLNGKTLTLKTGGNIDIISDVTVNDNQCAILVFYVDDTTPDANGNYVVATVSSTGGGSTGYNLIQDEGVGLPTRTTIDFIGAGVVASDGPGAKTTVEITGAGAGLLPDLSNLASPTVPNKGIEMNNKAITELQFLQGLTGTPGTQGLLRTGNNQIFFSSRNAANTGNIEGKVNALDILDFTRSDNIDFVMRLRAQDAVFPDVSLNLTSRHLGALGGEAVIQHPNIISFVSGLDVIFDIRTIGTRVSGDGKFVFDPSNIGLSFDFNDKTLFQPGTILWDEFGVSLEGKALTNQATGLAWFFEQQTFFHFYLWEDTGGISRTHMEVGVAGIFGGSNTSVPIIRWHIKARTIQQIGFQVTNESITNNVGTEGSMQMPRLSTFPVPFTAAQFDLLFGDVSGCYAVINTGGTPTLVVRRDNGQWFGLTLALIV